MSTKRLVGGILAAALLLPSSSALAADPALAALRTGDVYVSPAVAADTQAAKTRLLATVAALRKDNRPVKIAVVRGPVGSPTMLSYARTLHRSLGYTGTLVVAAPSQPVGVEGPMNAAAVTRRLREANVTRIPNTIERAAKAAELTAAKLAPPGNSGTRGLLALLGLTLMGGLWAVASGVRRRQAGEREQLHAAREIVAEGVEELGRRVEQAGQGLPMGTVGERLADAAQEYASAREELDQARSIEDLRRLVPRLERGLAATESAGGLPAAELVARLQRATATHE